MKQFWFRYHLLLCLLPFLLNTLVGQNQMGTLIFENDFTILDTLRLEILYQVDFVEDTFNFEEKHTDQQVLQIGFHTSLYFSKLLYENDSVNTILENQNVNYFHAIPKGAAEYEITRDQNSSTLVVTHRSEKNVFRYSEEIPVIEWTIHNERKVIRQYICQRTTSKFRGREYEAWFTPEIPIREGPYKFGGLPGLILEMEESQKHYVYTCIGIRKPKSVEPIKIRNWPYTETTREKLNDFLTKKYMNPVSYYNSFGSSFWIKKDGQFVEAPKDFSLPYNPIELK